MLEGIIDQLKREVIASIRQCVKETNRSYSGDKDKKSKRYVVVYSPRHASNIGIHVKVCIYEYTSVFNLLTGRIPTTLEYEFLVFELGGRLDKTIHVYATLLRFDKETAVSENIDMLIKDSVEKRLTELGYKKMTIGPKDYYRKDLL